jgi:hypothetical protein
MRLVKRKIEIMMIPSFIEEIDGFYGFVSVEVVRFGTGVVFERFVVSFVVNHFIGLKSPPRQKLLLVFIPVIP